jgi:putative ABC transport system permease protein
LNQSFVNSISSIGTDVLYVARRNWIIQSRQEWIDSMKNPRITLAEVDVLQRQLNLAAAIAPVAQDNVSVKFKKRGSDSVPAIGTTADYLLTSGLTVAQGRFMTASECDGGRPVCVIGFALATNVFLNASPLGERIFIERRSFEVVGVLEKQGGMAESGGADNGVIVPLSQFTRAFWENPEYEIHVKAKNLDEIDDAKEELRTVLRRYRHIAPGDPDNFAINQQDQFLELFHKIAGTIEAIGLFITGLSLFVGGIGIMNIMFVSVAERTREIGVRKAIGAKRRTILLQFLIEAACICLIGGAIALLIAWPTTLLLQKVMPATLSPVVVGFALLVSAVTGILSGFFPAWRAARMNPVDALRNE